MIGNTVGPKPAINTYIAKGGASYGVDKSQQATVPPEVMMQMKLGPERLHAFIMDVSRNPHKYKSRTDTQRDEGSAKYDPFVVENKRPDERSEKKALLDILGGVYLKNNDPFKNTSIIYDAKSPKKQKQFYNSYDRSYGGYNSRLKVNPQLIMPIYGDSNSDRRKKGKKKGAIYNPEGIVTEDIYSMPTLEEFDQLVKLKDRVKNTKNSQTLEQRVKLLTN